MFIVSNQKEDSINIQRVNAAITTAANNNFFFTFFNFQGKQSLTFPVNPLLGVNQSLTFHGCELADNAGCESADTAGCESADNLFEISRHSWFLKVTAKI